MLSAIIVLLGAFPIKNCSYGSGWQLRNGLAMRHDEKWKILLFRIVDQKCFSEF